MTKHPDAKNPLFDDPIFRLCLAEALRSPCQKMRFGCVARYGRQEPPDILAVTHNKIVEPLRHLCEPTCIRLSITSRTEQMLGACGHAEEWALDEIHKRQLPSENCTLYVAGFAPDGKPYIKTERSHTCLRCSLQMYRAGVRVAVPFVDHWEFLTGEEAVKTAVAYATQEKKV